MKVIIYDNTNPPKEVEIESFTLIDKMFVKELNLIPAAFVYKSDTLDILERFHYEYNTMKELHRKREWEKLMELNNLRQK